MGYFIGSLDLKMGQTKWVHALQCTTIKNLWKRSCSYELSIIFKNSLLGMHKENGKWFKTLNFTANWLKSCEFFSIEMEFPGRKIC